MTRYKGTIPYGAAQSIEYIFEVPSQWNGTLFLYSHGISYDPLYAQTAIDNVVRNWLLDHGYALAGGSYADNGYEPGKQWPAQIAVLDAFGPIVGRRPTRVIAWGHSGGGHVVGALVSDAPQRFAGALAMCPLGLDGGVGRFNEQLDHMFVLKTLLGFSHPLVNIGYGHGQLSSFQNDEIALLQAAQTTKQGRARFALAEAMLTRQDWANSNDATRPAANDSGPVAQPAAIVGALVVAGPEELRELARKRFLHDGLHELAERGGLSDTGATPPCERHGLLEQPTGATIRGNGHRSSPGKRGGHPAW